MTTFERELTVRYEFPNIPLEDGLYSLQITTHRDGAQTLHVHGLVVPGDAPGAAAVSGTESSFIGMVVTVASDMLDCVSQVKDCDGDTWVRPDPGLDWESGVLYPRSTGQLIAAFGPLTVTAVFS